MLGKYLIRQPDTILNILRHFLCFYNKLNTMKLPFRQT